MHKLATIFKRTLHTVGITAALLMLILYVVAHYNLAGLMVEEDIKGKLSEKLQTRVEIENIEVNWLNQVGLNGIVIFDQDEDTLFVARRATIALEIGPLLKQKLVMNTIQLIDFQLMITRDSLNGKANHEFILEAVMPKGKNTQRKFINDISLHALLLRQGSISYNVLDQPKSNITELPDPNHLQLEELSASLSLEVSHITGMDVNLKRMKMEEVSGLSLKECKGKGFLSGDTLLLNNLTARLSRHLNDGTPCDISAWCDLQLNSDSLFLQMRSLDIEAGDDGEIHSRFDLQLPLIAPQEVVYQAEFLPSSINRQTIEHIMQLADIQWSEDVRPWAEQVNKLQWRGIVNGHASDSIVSNGVISTSGILNSELLLSICHSYHKEHPWLLKAKGDIATLLYNRHLYTGLSIEGESNLEEYIGKFACTDPLLNTQGNATVKVTNQHTQIEGQVRIQQIAPYALNLTSLSNINDLAFAGNAHIVAEIPHRLQAKDILSNLISANKPLPEGYIRIDSLYIIGPQDTLPVGTAHITLQREQGVPVFAAISSIGKLVGTPSSIIGHLPANPRFAHLIKSPGEWGKDISIQAEWDSIAQRVTASLNIPEWINGDNIASIALQGQGPTNKETPIPENLDLDMDFKYQTPSHQLASKVSANYQIDPMYVKFKPSTLSLDGKDFNTTDAILRQNEKGDYFLSDLTINDKDQKLQASGRFGSNQDVNMFIDLSNWQIDFFLDILHKGYLDFGGYATGQLAVSSDSSLHLKTDYLRIEKFTYIGNTLGTGYLKGNYNFDNGHLNIGADIQSYPAHTTHAECDVLLGPRDSLDLAIQLDSLPVEFLSYWIGGAIQDLHGHASGEARLYGDCDSLNLTGHPLLQNVNFTHDLLGARFFITDTLNMTTDEEGNGFVGLNNISLRDRNGQTAVLTLDLEHHHLHNMEYGLDLDIPDTQNGFLIYDHPNQKEGELYWGRLWATGRCQMHGTYSRHRIGVQMAPAGRSIFNLSPGEENFTENAYNFLTFRDKKNYLLDEENAFLNISANSFESKKEDSDPIYVEADLMIQANERCQVYIQMDPLAEDRLICRGNGDLALHYDPHHDINLTGNYDISSGSYTVTMKGDVMTKAFQLQPGSRVTFPGSPSEAELDLKATYNIPSANLRDLDESFATVASLSRTTLPVDCKLNVTGQITAPQIAFDLEVKNTSDDVQALVHNIIGTQEMLNREVFYLLLFSKFYTPEYASTSQRQTGSELTSFASSSLTSQLNNLLGHMSDNFTLGTNFRSDKGDFSDMEMDVSVSTRLLNDRLLMTGNLGYRDRANSLNMNQQNNTFIGDFDVEYLINTKGTVRAKVYSHYNDRDYSINNALTTQGIGIILRKDFKSFSELLKRKQQIAK